jgi:hypothetical protein
MSSRPAPDVASGVLRRFGTRTQLLVAASLYTALAILWCHQLFIAGFGSTLPNDTGDPLLNTWVLWWNHRSLATGANWWNAPAFFPAEGVLSFTETLLAISVLTTPLMALGVSPVAAYNTAFVFSFAASAMAMYLLCRECTDSHVAALVGGAYFGFGAHRATHLAQVQILWTLWIPILFLALFRYRASTHPKYLLLAGIAWTGVALSSVYFLLYGAVAVALWGLWFLANRQGFGLLLRLALTGTAATAVVAPLLLEFRRWHEYYGFRRSIGEMEGFSADALSFLDGPHLLWTWPNVQSLDRPEGALYPGILTLGLLSVAAWQWWRGRASPDGSARLSLALLGPALVMIAIGLAAAWTGGAQWNLGLLDISVSTPYKPIGVGCVLLLGAVLALPSIRESWRQRSVVGWWIFCAVSAYIFALGPTGRFAGYRFWYKAPYSWLLMLPGFDSARAPARFGTLLALALAVLVALAVRRFAGATRATWMPAAALVAVLVDGALTIPAVPVPRTVHAGSWGVDMVLEIPLETYRDTAAMSGSFTHGRPVVNGYSGFGPPHYAVLRSAVSEGRTSVLDELRRLGTLAVVADATTADGIQWLRLLEPFARPDLAAPWGHQVFVLPRLPERSACLARALGPQTSGPRVAALANLRSGTNSLALAMDGDWATFDGVSESASVGNGFDVALSREQTIDGLVLWMGPVPNDHPALLRVAIRGPTGTQTVFEGDVAGLAMSGVLADPRRAPIAICFLPITASGLVLSVPETTKRPWNVAEVSVLAP